MALLRRKYPLLVTVLTSTFAQQGVIARQPLGLASRRALDRTAASPRAARTAGLTRHARWAVHRAYRSPLGTPRTQALRLSRRSTARNGLRCPKRSRRVRFCRQARTLLARRPDPRPEGRASRSSSQSTSRRTSSGSSARRATLTASRSSGCTRSSRSSAPGELPPPRRSPAPCLGSDHVIVLLLSASGHVLAPHHAPRPVVLTSRPRLRPTCPRRAPAPPRRAPAPQQRRRRPDRQVGVRGLARAALVALRRSHLRHLRQQLGPRPHLPRIRPRAEHLFGARAAGGKGGHVLPDP